MSRVGMFHEQSDKTFVSMYRAYRKTGRIWEDNIKMDLREII
jgi:hypothetical protein